MSEVTKRVWSAKPSRDWEYTYVRRIDQSAGGAELERRLDDGWEPFAATEAAAMVTVHLRRRVARQPQMLPVDAR